MVQVAVYLVMALLGLGILAMVGFGIRSLSYGKVEKMTVVFMAVPVVILLLFG